MSALAQLRINDLRPRLNVKDNPAGYPKSRRNRVGPIDSATVHYNGPAVGVFGNAVAELNHIVNIDVPNHQSRIGADSLMYHFCVLSDGSIWQTRDINFIAWHCAHPYGNEHSIAIHLPIGDAQKPTAAQLVSLSALLDALGEDYGFARAAVRGHQEWHASQCPGVPLMTWLRDWRKQARPIRGGLTVAAAPRISSAKFAAVLAKFNSPATGLAADLYGICVSEGIDPAVALAFFVHESSAGTAGLTAQYDLKNWGNVRSPEDVTLGTAVPIPNRGNFAKYISWQNGLRDWCKRLKGPKYTGKGLLTVEAITPVYAPDKDGNSPALYAQAVNAAVAAWAAEDNAPAPAPRPIIRWRCINKAGINVRTAPNLKGHEVGTIACGQVVEVGLVKTDGDVEAVRGDNRWLWLANGAGFVWAGNFVKES